MNALSHLAKADKKLGRLIAQIGPLKRRKREFTEPYEALISAVAHQQLHGKAAMTIMGRFRALADGNMPTPEQLLALPDEALRACGFSGAKARALQDIAAHAVSGIIPSAAQAKKLSDAELIKRLTVIRGVGQWTVEMLLIFTLRRPDIFPVDDFGVREGYKILHGLDEQPKPKPFAIIGEAYAPYRSTAALYLWQAADLAKLQRSAKAK
ncbi:MAG: DNA-3-methyladenine glycosylase [Acidocella sp. 20-57-95]|nr:MAG: DNA-3-methyladenine glycosylase [Acidocella sp. 20-57-95]HQT63422.1 DNA-3-methyladenine glycosylase [Acidocella sp.]HQU04919.1 DNA-3-methyladenine glycosylase [Acidocella sp.]